jgi:hypothetical protein
MVKPLGPMALQAGAEHRAASSCRCPADKTGQRSRAYGTASDQSTRWVAYADNGRPETPLAGLAAWVGAFIWIPGFLLAVVILPLIYPTGRWQSPAWRRVGRAALIFTLLAVLIAATSNELMMRDYPGYNNPLGVFPWSDSAAPLLIIVGCAVVFACVGLVALILRFRSGDPTVRAQVGWLFLALLFNIAVAPLPTEILGLIGAAFLALALGLAVVRYGLYDIERLFTRAVVYGALTTGIVAVFDCSPGEVDADGIPALPAAVEVAAYRIAFEALSNTLRYAEASLCTVRLIADGSLHLEVHDNGRGLPEAITHGVGLGSMAERAAELGGSCMIESSPGSGTTVRAELPLTVAS